MYYEIRNKFHELYYIPYCGDEDVVPALFSLMDGKYKK